MEFTLIGSTPIRETYMPKPSLIKCFGGKAYLAEWIISLFPPQYGLLRYIEPFAGGASVLFRKNISAIEVISDVDYELICIYEATKHHLDEFVDILSKVEYSEEVFQTARKFNPIGQSLLVRAANEYVLRRMSRGGLRTSFAWSERLRGGIPGDKNAWLNSIKNLPWFSKRLENVYILNNDFRLLLSIATSQCLVYIDSPYLHETRVSTKAYGKYEMSVEAHNDLLDIALFAPAKILISGYDSELYNRKLSSWNRFEKEIVNHSSQTKVKQKKKEIVWRNF